ncbi:MAG TPA: P1 family peptidase [Steroidobacteraceae bacterium]|nr:P1 family peptidase [Steroidobacteraceae bacterium]
MTTPTLARVFLGATLTGLAGGVLGAAPPAAPPAAASGQAALVPVINAGERLLRFDWPALRIGTGEYEEGPTGLTVFQFAKRASAAVDVRGGSPGTVNTDYLRQGYPVPVLDAVVFAGGSAYGLEATTAVMSAMKDDGLRGGAWDNIAFAAGAIIYDLGDRRLNEVYPDKRLAQAAYRAARPGLFPLGAQGAGRFAMNGRIFGCNVYSGEGGAFRQIGDLKIAAFTVVNAVGVVTARDGRVAACYRDPKWPADLRTADLFARFPATSRGEWPAVAAEPHGNTTISLVVTNRQLQPAQLQRLAALVHTSMARAVQPFATEFDGDVLYAVSTGELETPANPLEAFQIDVLASEVMWDAVLAAIPPQPAVTAPAGAAPAPRAEELRRYAGDYGFGRGVCLRIAADGPRLTAIAAGPLAVYAIGGGAPTALEPAGGTQFRVPGRYPLSLRFDGPSTVVVNPGHWQQTGTRQKDCGSPAREAAR